MFNGCVWCNLYFNIVLKISGLFYCTCLLLHHHYSRYTFRARLDSMDGEVLSRETTNCHQMLPTIINVIKCLCVHFYGTNLHRLRQLGTCPWFQAQVDQSIHGTSCQVQPGPKPQAVFLRLSMVGMFVNLFWGSITGRLYTHSSNNVAYAHCKL